MDGKWVKLLAGIYLDRMLRKKWIVAFQVLILFVSSFTLLFSQPILIKLTKRTVLDDNYIHIVPFHKFPKEQLKVPDIDVSEAVYFYIYYTDTETDDAEISVLVLRLQDKDLLYIDKNNDEDLMDDGPPSIFPIDRNDFLFGIVSRNDPKQITRIQLRRKLICSDPDKQKKIDSVFYDSSGNLKGDIVADAARKVRGFKGEPRSYYFDDRVGLSRGKFEVSAEEYQIGIFDFNNNGLFNDVAGEDGDLLLIDLNRDNKLTDSNAEEVFHLDDVFRVRNQSYKLADIDPYGRFIIINKVSGNQPSRLLERIENNKSKPEFATSLALNPAFWGLTFSDINNLKTRLKRPEGKYVLLNIWGEWCMPCVEEIPELVAIQEKYSGKLAVISFLKPGKIGRAKELIEKKQMDWAQLILTPDLAKRFYVRGFPTNILISPGGRVLFYKNRIEQSIIASYLEGKNN